MADPQDPTQDETQDETQDDRQDQTQDETSPEPQVPILREPRDGVPEPLVDADRLARVVDTLAAGTGPVAVDAERASGYRYSQRAYLVQLRRAGAGSVLIDPIALPELGGVDTALADAEWILHAANQDLACLAELGMRPRRLFDTELAGRLLGEERVALGTMVRNHLGVGLEKGHSAADWSTRPLPYDWLVYATLDVELLIELRDKLAADLEAAGKLDWAMQEFEAVRLAPPVTPRAEPWRRTSGIHRIRDRRALARVRELWQARDDYAQARDIAPGRVLPDSAMVNAAQANPAGARDLAALPVFGGPRQRRQLGRWFGALQRARELPAAQLPTVTGGRDTARDSGRDTNGDPMPATSRWRERDPQAAARLAAVRAVIAELAEQHTMLAQNLLASDVVRRLCWEPPEPADEAAVRERLDELGARPWQIDVSAAAVTAALADAGT